VLDNCVKYSFSTRFTQFLRRHINLRSAVGFNSVGRPTTAKKLPDRYPTCWGVVKLIFCEIQTVISKIKKQAKSKAYKPIPYHLLGKNRDINPSVCICIHEHFKLRGEISAKRIYNMACSTSLYQTIFTCLPALSVRHGLEITKTIPQIGQGCLESIWGPLSFGAHGLK